MLSRPAGLVSLGNRQQPPLPTALRWRREKPTFYLSGRSALSFASFAPSLRSPTSPGSGRAASVDLPPVGLWVQSDKSPPPAPTGRARGRGDLGRTLLCPEVCISRPARQKPPTVAAFSLPALEERSCAQACPRLTPILPLRYLSMTGARRTLPTGEGAGIISAGFISSFRSAPSPVPRAARPRLSVPVPLLCLSKRSRVPSEFVAQLSPPRPAGRNGNPSSRNEGDDANLETDPTPGNDTPPTPPGTGRPSPGMNG
ncbi:phosphatase and actin regulator 4A-like [Hyaena hyaena]|uniref:phosphatase and actin regulator 4A-like n=1 Tax=Hyaena hyaena TaxID=95912 RepID=UPI0019220110|nr:phosphatase and actin regulator 4A-like [Hyaena hyaena]